MLFSARSCSGVRMTWLALPFSGTFGEVVALLLMATLAGAIAVRLNQPTIVGFIAVGILIGPSGLDWAKAGGQIRLLAEIGLALLLFIVGLRLDVYTLRILGPVALVTAAGQVALTAVGGYAIALGLGMSAIPAAYVAIAIVFSSTIIAIKLLSDKRETDSLHGRIAIGILIIQDILVILAMIALSALAGETQQPKMQVFIILGKAVGLLAVLAIISLFALPRVLDQMAKSVELLVLFAIAWALGLATICEAVGLSREVGAFLAGVSLATTTFREIIGARLVGLRDFLLVFFFIQLGSRLDLGLLGPQPWLAIPLSFFTLIGKPLIVMVVMGLLGYRRRTSFMVGLTGAQVSEFSFILVALGADIGHISQSTMGLVTLVGLATIGISTYLITYSEPIYDMLSPYLKIFERRVRHREQSADAPSGEVPAGILLFGLGRYGSNFARRLRARGREVIGVDFDPQAIKLWNRRGWPAFFGDAEDPEFAAMLPLSQSRWVVSSIRNERLNTTLMHALRLHDYIGHVAVTAHNNDEAKRLLATGADLAFVPFADAAEEAVDLLMQTEEQIARAAMDRTIDSMRDHYIVCGYGRMGKQIVQDLRSQNQPVVVVESNPEQIPKLKEHDTPHVQGTASEDEVLIRAGVMRAKGLIAVAATDEENVFIVLSAKGLNPGLFIVARSILAENEDKLKRAGADKVMSPYILGGHRMAAALLKPRAVEFLDRVALGTKLDVEEITVPAQSALVGRTLRDISIRETCGVTLLAIRHKGGELMSNPDPAMVVEEQDELIVMGAPEQLEAAEQVIAGR